MSQAFKRSLNWETLTVDIEPKFNPTICSDIRDLNAKEIENATRLKRFSDYEKIIMLMSPPCQRFSTAALRWGWPKKGIKEALHIVGSCLELVAEIAPDEWLLENPRGFLRWILGKPRMTVKLSTYGFPTTKPTDLWATFDLPLAPQDDWLPQLTEKWANGKLKKRWDTFEQRRPEARAKMPELLSQAILQSVEETA